jgi:hypothetical protein
MPDKRSGADIWSVAGGQQDPSAAAVEQQTQDLLYRRVTGGPGTMGDGKPVVDPRISNKHQSPV